MQRLEIELVDRFDGDKLHGGTQHGFSDRFRVAEVVLLPFGVRPDIILSVVAALVSQLVRSPSQVHDHDHASVAG
jgi:hypothetical protein